MQRMEADPRIGTCQRQAVLRSGRANWSCEKCGDENSVGMVKFYRTECFKQIGGFVRELMWDGIDCHRCRMLGWIAVSWDDPSLNFEHLRPMGTSHKNWWTGRVRHGVGQHYMGTGISYLLASGPVPARSSAGGTRFDGNAMGLFPQHARSQAALRRRRVPALRPPVPMALPAPRQKPRDPRSKPPAGISMARRPQSFPRALSCASRGCTRQPRGRCVRTLTQRSFGRSGLLQLSSNVQSATAYGKDCGTTGCPAESSFVRIERIPSTRWSLFPLLSAGVWVIVLRAASSGSCSRTPARIRIAVVKKYSHAALRHAD